MFAEFFCVNPREKKHLSPIDYADVLRFISALIRAICEKQNVILPQIMQMFADFYLS
jgi:hypothetical protein